MLNKFILLGFMAVLFFASSVFINFHNSAFADILFQEQFDTINAVTNAKKSVVSIIKTKDITSVIADETSSSVNINANIKQVSGGSGVLVSSDGLILTNKHVVADGDEYTVILHNGEIFKSNVVARDPIEDLALIKISIKDKEDISVASFVDSRHLRVGQTVIAMGYSLGRYENSVTKGVVSGLNRSLIASGTNNTTVNLSNIIQTDAAINLGNSGGILIDLTGRVVGISTAVETLGENVGFAIPANTAKKTISSYKKYGKIKRPKLGLRYTMIDPMISRFAGLPRDNGAWVHSGTNDSVILSDSPAERAGLTENDIIFEINAIKITEALPLSEVINYYEPGQKIGLKVQRGDKVVILEAILGSFE